LRKKNSNAETIVSHTLRCQDWVNSFAFRATTPKDGREFARNAAEICSAIVLAIFSGTGTPACAVFAGINKSAQARVPVPLAHNTHLGLDLLGGTKIS
jgi:hypothetical protein